MKQLPYHVVFYYFCLLFCFFLNFSVVIHCFISMLKGSYSRLVILSLGPIDTLDKMIPAVRGSPVHCRVLSIIPIDTSNTRWPPLLTTKHVTRHCCRMSLGSKISPGWNHCFRQCTMWWQISPKRPLEHSQEYLVILLGNYQKGMGSCFLIIHLSKAFAHGPPLHFLLASLGSFPHHLLQLLLSSCTSRWRNIPGRGCPLRCLLYLYSHSRSSHPFYVFTYIYRYTDSQQIHVPGHEFSIELEQPTQ